jgi:DNA polymerase elongation subunit (family B)
MKILLFDVETMPLVVTSWQLFEPRLSHDNILQDTSLICAAWKFYGEKNIHTTQIDPARPGEDKEVCKTLHEAISRADVIVGHNGDEFDLRTLRSRILFNGLPPLPPKTTIDTLKVARRLFRLSSNRLDYLGSYLGVGRKIPTSFGLWLDVMNGSKEALNKMVKYNKQDVLLLERVYEQLRPHMSNHPNQRLYSTGGCPICGYGPLVKQGFKYQRTSVRQQYQCKSCHGYSCGEKVGSTEIK